jgi:hypothetical protein
MFVQFAQCLYNGLVGSYSGAEVSYSGSSSYAMLYSPFSYAVIHAECSCSFEC